MALPNVITSLIMTVYAIVDGIFIGRFVGPQGLAAVNLSMPILGFAVAVINMISIGASVQIAMKLGDNKLDDANKTFTYTLFVQMVYGLILVVLGLLFIDQILGLFKVSATVFNYAKDYLIIFIILLPLYMLSYGIGHYIRTAGGSLLNMYTGIGTTLLNIILDYIFIVIFKWGTKGAALATCISAGLLGLYLLSHFLRGKLVLSFTKIRIDLKELIGIIFNGSSEFFTSIAASVSGLIINIVILSLVGDVGIAALSILLYLEHIIMAVLFGIGDGLQPVISYNYGAKNYDKMWSVFTYALKIGGVFSIVIFAIMALGAEEFSTLFIASDNEMLLTITQDAMKVYVYGLPFAFLVVLSSLYFTALGKPLESIGISLSHTLFFKLLFVMVLPNIFGVSGVWLSLVISYVLAFVVSVVLLKRSRSNLKNASEIKLVS